MLKSKILFTEEDRQLIKSKNNWNDFQKRCLNALEIAESENEELREKLQFANIQIYNLENLK